ncbi:hypothetical protein Syun_008906 [Stephania yunnanensis]|uniref:Uncharacterized protein n=1 Tax=Stephania yunnanensis TaxID=152371 RepID=A0AAP0KDP2_9MAGN
MDQYNPQPKSKQAMQANESDVQSGETGVEHGAASSFVGDKDGFTPGGASRDGTEISRTPTYGVGSEDNVVDIEGANSPSTSSDAEDEMTTSFHGGATTLELLPSFCHHVLLDIWRNNVFWHTTKKKAPPVHKMDFYLGSMRFMDVIKPHNPVRVLRQMGYVQGIPEKPYKPIYADRRKLTHTYSVKYNYDPQVWEEWEDHLIARNRRGERAVFLWKTALGYL